MLPTRLVRAQLELQVHRTWLRAFTTKTLQPQRASTCEATEIRSHHGDRRSYGIPIKRIGAKPRRSPKPRIAQTDYDAVFSIRDALQKKQLDLAAQLYHDLPDKKVLDADTAEQITYVLVDVLRLARRQAWEIELVTRLQKFVEELATDVRKGVLISTPGICMALLSFFQASQKWDAGRKLWTWIEARGDEILTPGVYAVAIEFLAMQDVELADLEALYQQALLKCSGSFAAYHFAPGSVVSNRDHESRSRDLPMTLLRAISFARLLRGDSMNAYLALDTTLRLSPSRLSALYFRDFMQERPIAEAYGVFAVACRAGTAISNNVYRALLMRLRTDLDPRGLKRLVFSLRSMLSATYLHIGANGTVNSNAVSEILIGTTSLMRTAEISALSIERKREFANALHETIHEILMLFVGMDVSPSISAFNSIITNIGGYGHSREAIDAALRSADIIGLAPTIVTRRSILTAAGNLKDVELIKESWKTLVEERAAIEQYPDNTDLHILVKACKLANIPDLARAAIHEMQHLEEFQIEGALERLESAESEDGSLESQQQTDASVYFDELNRLKADLAVLRLNFGEGNFRGFRDFSTQRLPMTLVPPPADVQLPETEMRALYDEMTTDPTAVQSSSADDQAEPAVSRTNIPLGTLRYENWKSLTYLLSSAEQHDRAYFDAVDKAIAQGERPPARPKGLLRQEGGELGGLGLSDLQSDEGVHEHAVGKDDAQKKKQRILALRKAGSPE